MKKVNKIIGIICLVLLLASITLYFVTGAKWTEITMLIALGLAGVFNLFVLLDFSKLTKRQALQLAIIALCLTLMISEVKMGHAGGLITGCLIVTGQVICLISEKRENDKKKKQKTTKTLPTTTIRKIVLVCQMG